MRDDGLFKGWPRSGYVRVVSRTGHTLLVLLLVASARADDFPAFNARVGSQTFQPKYAFTTNTRLVETATALRDLGSDIVKFELSANTTTNYHLPAAPSLTNLTLLASNEPSVRAVLDMPFPYTLVWAYPLTVPNEVNHPWRDGLSATESNLQYNEIYTFARHLLRTYNDSGRTFLLGHWEGDWALLGTFNPNATPTASGLRGMADWLGTRQRAVDAAKADEPHTNVFVWNYAEVNLVKKALTGGVTVVNNVLTNVTVDLVSYSCYDVLGDPAGALTNALHYIATKAHTSGHFYRDVFIGEYGFPLDNGLRTPAQQATLSDEVIRSAAGWGCPFVLYWQMFDNEAAEGGANARGFWLVDTNGVQQPVYETHREYLQRAHAFKNVYRFWLQRNPDEAALSDFAPRYASVLLYDVLSNILASAEYSNRVSDADYIGFLVRNLFGGNPAHDEDGDLLAAALASGETRFTVLRAALDSERFAALYSAEDFVDMLYGGTLGRTPVNHDAPDVQQAVYDVAGGHISRSRLWMDFITSSEYARGELLLRDVNEVGAREVFTKSFFDPDRDVDGMGDGWERAILNASTNDGLVTLWDVAPTADYDGDGWSNGDEYRMGTSPLAADSDNDGVAEAVEVAPGDVVDGLTTPTNLIVMENSGLIDHHDGTVSIHRTNTTPAWTESIVDWQPGASFLSVTGTPWISLVPVGFVSGGWCSVALQYFDSNGAYMAEPAWFDEDNAAGFRQVNAAALAAANGLGSAAHYRLRFRLGPADNGLTWPGVRLTSIAATRTRTTMPFLSDTDGDGMGDGAEVVAGTEPTDAADVLALEPAVVPDGGGVIVRWPSVSNRVYDLDRSDDVAGLGSPQVLSSNLPATPPMNCYTDVPSGAAYYRVRVR
jgi:hypothetical protein